MERGMAYTTTAGSIISASIDEWVIGLAETDERYTLLMHERPAHEIVEAVNADLASQVVSGAVFPILEAAQSNSYYERFSATIRLCETTFDILMNGRSGYRAQFYVGLEIGRRFNRLLIDSMLPSLERAWETNQDNKGDWPLALRSLTHDTAKIWAEMDVGAVRRQPKLNAKMWQLNCEETEASDRGLCLFSNKPPTIEVKGAWVSQQSTEIWVPVRKRCRDEMLRCFGFT
jgi:hypothetical protein